MNTLDAFSGFNFRLILLIHFNGFDAPRRCNNLEEAITTNNWCYINTHFYSKNTTGC